MAERNEVGGNVKAVFFDDRGHSDHDAGDARHRARCRCGGAGQNRQLCRSVWRQFDGYRTDHHLSIAINVKKLCEDRQKVLLIGTSADSVFSQKECSRASVIYGVNTYCMPKGAVSALLQRGLDSWFFITADYAFGHALE